MMIKEIWTVIYLVHIREIFQSESAWFDTLNWIFYLSLTLVNDKVRIENQWPELKFLLRWTSIVGEKCLIQFRGMGKVGMFFLFQIDISERRPVKANIIALPNTKNVLVMFF